ncbi:unnamed protein product [Euphydryas editha]|uniref:Cationic amino acid transporter C-terminal domain-containing protein n=1 Tax=Euphydryas editha TaxID=104508 RepID=A0AAU9UF97_EUPED|nr:unnamed protein product [Euphydryas editha]
MAGKWNSFCRTLQRRRVFEPHQLDTGNLKRCLSIWDLTALGVGSSLGVGVYVLVGSVALHLAGPSVVLSFLVAAIAAIFAGMCYAEFGSRVPKAGSAYIYAYVTVGEFIAFIIGWDMILEAVFGTASVARGLSMYVDSMTNYTMSAWFESVVPLGAAPFSTHFDFFSFIVVIVLGGLLAFGVRESTLVNNVLTGVNIAVILFAIIAGAFEADVSNWSIASDQVPPEGSGNGGFFPFGVWGMLKGAAVCFYGFVGFDSISSTGEEVRDPRRAIPISIMCTQVIVFLVYASVATVVTMMMPYYLQVEVASVATAFTYVGMDWARWVVTVGAIVGITASLYGSMFPLPRLLYSMSSDGLLLHWLARLTSKRKSPMIATLLSTFVIAILAAILELNELILMMCIGTLLSYTVVACCVIILRYRSGDISNESNNVKRIFGFGERLPTKTTSRIIITCLLLFICTCLASSLVIHHVQYPVVYVAILHIIAFLLIVVMTLQPQLNEELAFKTPLVPLVPCVSIYVNINLMMFIKLQTWIRVIVWMAIGIPVYFLSLCCYKQNDDNFEDGINATNMNGKAPVQIYVVSPTPPDTITRSKKGGNQTINEDDQIEKNESKNNVILDKVSFVTEEIIVQHAYYEDNSEKEAKIIDLLDQVLQAEEDSYAEITSIEENNVEENEENVIKEQENVTHRKSLSELSDAGSDASSGNQVLSKYDVIAQVHREDLPRVNEEEEKSDREEAELDKDNNLEDEEITAFNDSDSQTDESGYSDTIDRTMLNESNDNIKEEEPKIPVPPPLDENFFANPGFIKSYTISVRPPKPRTEPEPEVNRPRESVQSNSSIDDTPMVFGSDKQMNFMSKLNNIFQSKIASDNDEEPKNRRRSNSTGNVAETSELTNIQRPSIYFDLKKEIISRDMAQNLRHVNVVNKEESTDEEDNDTGLSREELKTKLEGIFKAGGPHLLMKPRKMKSNPPTPEEAYQTDTSSTESISKLSKVDKNDTLGRQKTKFSEVLNSFRLMINKDDVV